MNKIDFSGAIPAEGVVIYLKSPLIIKINQLSQKSSSRQGLPERRCS
ncbi:hypothetical protein [Methylicorpusculum sp.]|nr:hypothetical protein [Methylicorpusculum sp.]MDP3528658.1 hypothetical protein [Methylicorpusculum sp.]MDZ4150918.1 hypothetical protein [Methylicorpusculum sp.]